MSRPVFWPRSTIFYPVGNTPPVCLTQCLAPEEPARILLLGCGDPRSILYTIHAGAQIFGSSRQLDFTCCDVQAAVLARNVLLFSLIVDNGPIDRIWNIFYHFKLDPQSLGLLVSQCKKLVGMSTGLGRWSTSPYARFLRVCNVHTLSQLHHHWKLYALAENFSKSKNDVLCAGFLQKFARFLGDSEPLKFNIGRSAGPLSADVAPALTRHFEHFCKTGTLSTEPDAVAAATKINPTFVYSMTGEGCAVHCATYPLLAFHLTSVFCTPRTEALQAGDFISCARQQFQQWCDSFRAAVSPNSKDIVAIRVFVGDALALCRTLYHCRVASSISASIYVSAWTGTELVLDGGDYGADTVSAAPTTFNVIDTSNVSDHIGLLNVLIVAAPILSHGPSSTLYTETLHAKGKDAAMGLIERLGADIPAVGLLLGLTPAAYVSSFSTCSNTHQLLSLHTFDSQQDSMRPYHERVAWKIPHLCDPFALKANTPYLSFNPILLAKLLHDIYYHMFGDDDEVGQLQMGIIPEIKWHYHPATFAVLLAAIKSRVDTDWNTVIDTFFVMLSTDHTLQMNLPAYQDLRCQLHIRGISSIDTTKPDFSNPVYVNRARGIFKGWKEIPPVVCLVLVVPRTVVRDMETTKMKFLGPLPLQIEINGNRFSSAQMTFGWVSLKGSGSDAHVVLREDAAGWAGSSPLVVSVWVPSNNLVDKTQGSPEICLCVRLTPASARLLGGIPLPLFTAGLLDSKHVHIVAERPNRVSELAYNQASRPRSQHGMQAKAYVALSNFASVTCLAAKWDVSRLTDHDPSATVTHKQTSLCSIRLQWGKHEKLFVYPCPIDGKKTKLLIFRKQGWVEAVVPVHRPLEGYNFSLTKFASVQSPNDPPIVWNVHNVNLERLPILSTTNREKVSTTISSHLDLSLSDREQRLHEQTESSSASHDDVMLHIKKSINDLILRATEKNAHRVFSFTDPSGHSSSMVLFLNDIRIDLSAHTFIADVCVLPLTKERVTKLGNIIDCLTASGQMGIINTSEHAVTAWKQLLPAFVERCRTWSHKPTCEYLRAGTIPTTVGLTQNPLCSCGEGISLGALSKVPEWNKLAPHMTRAAISPLFAAPHIESVGGYAYAKNAGSIRRSLSAIWRHMMDTRASGRHSKPRIWSLSSANRKLLNFARHIF